jgi:carbon-monoxide dehydrogenase iron sulfur subunit
MAKGKLIINFETCTGCLSCEFACAKVHLKSKTSAQAFAKTAHEKDPVAIRIVDPARSNVELPCVKCRVSPCDNSCNLAYVQRDEASGMAMYVTDKCIGCQMCVKACPTGSLTFVKEEKKADTEKVSA